MEVKTMQNKVNQRIVQLCNERGWTKYKLSKESDIPNSSVNAILKYNHTPTIETIEKICQAFNITLSQFFDCELFSAKKPHIYSELWNRLSVDKQEKVLIYMYGLLHEEIPKEVSKNDL